MIRSHFFKFLIVNSVLCYPVMYLLVGLVVTSVDIAIVAALFYFLMKNVRNSRNGLRSA